MSQASPVLKSAAVESRRPRSGFSWRGCRSLQNNRSKPNTPRSEGPGAALQIPRWLVFWFCGAVAELLSGGATIQKNSPVQAGQSPERGGEGGRRTLWPLLNGWFWFVCVFFL